MLETPQNCTIHTIDTNWLGLPRYTAAYLLEGPGGLALVETGPFCSNDNIVAGVRALGHKPGDVRHVLVSHIHLDHAGAAWWWARQGSQVHVHEFGARHLVDPSVLMNSATRIYGDRMDFLWGRMEPIDAARVTAVHDGDVLEVAGLRIMAIETPGHARHHHAYALTTAEHGRVCFTGDVGAMIMPEGDFIAVPTPPPEFDLEAWLASLNRLEAMAFDVLYPSHFDRCRAEPNAYFRRLARALIAHAEFARQRIDRGAMREEIFRDLVDWQRQVAARLGTPDRLFQDYTVDHLLDMNVTGLMRYWTKKRESAGPA